MGRVAKVIWAANRVITNNWGIFAAIRYGMEISLAGIAADGWWFGDRLNSSDSKDSISRKI